ncbi:aminoacyl-tRNA hydrolase [Candidatus Cerribacteria bacterium 'Amazon FNV 2010 28 9']|uniref:Peptidyl-tRNA hydrolase n=1 Tax=Candidatus Cerribacteria bacterium 'Amazon FNV 2010 28 9' TaxID=2081795 RepID=A0A317JS83_9BACT|nr:MAG: aminoacyl-tRNA hydrolase [Candidatus Cerribacteria bacterium 'Amazon FNV 2010 28 9']
MYFIVGLGNPGPEYERTRHNVGFMALDALAQRFGVSFHFAQKWNGEVAKIPNGFLIKPHTYMNESGVCVQKVIHFYDHSSLILPSKRGGNLELRNVFVFHDDLDMKVGTHKFIFGKGPKVHNGVNSIREHLGTDQFWYVRFGIDGRDPGTRIEPQTYVLSPFTSDEQPLMKKAIVAEVEKVYQILK